MLLVIVFIPVFSGFLKSDSSLPASLHVPFIPQKGNTWCWAACTEMAMKYYHDKINPNAPAYSQCELVKMSNPGDGTHCPPDTIPADRGLNQSGFPFDQTCGYQIKHTYGRGSALSQQQLEAQIAAKVPVIFQWQWSGITHTTRDSYDFHWLVAEGCPRSSFYPNKGWVSIHDPLPVGRGRHRIITYNEYANKRPLSFPGYTKYVFNAHGYDYYQLQY